MTPNKKFLISLVIIGIMANLTLTLINVAFGWAMPVFAIVAWYASVNACLVAGYVVGR